MKVLAIDDQQLVLLPLQKRLVELGYEIKTETDSVKGLELYESFNPDLVIVDINMPGISGLEATKRIREFDKELTIFALTAVTIEDKMHEFDEAGFDDIISKPFKQADFEKKLYNTLIGDKATAS